MHEGRHPSQSEKAVEFRVWYFDGFRKPRVVDVDPSSDDKPQFLILEPEHCTVNARSLGRSPKGQALYGQAAQWHWAAQGAHHSLKLGHVSGDTFVEASQQPDLHAAFRDIDQRSDELPRADVLSGGGRFDKALKKWLDEGRTRLPNANWDAAEAAVRASKASRVLVLETESFDCRLLEPMVKQLGHVKQVDLKESNRPELAFQLLRELPNLSALELDGSTLTDQTLMELPPLPGLEMLSLRDCALTSHSIGTIAKCCPLLIGLDLSGTKITESKLTTIRKLAKTLAHLSVNETALSNDAMTVIGDLSNLMTLFAENTRINDKSAFAFAKLTNLKFVRLNGTDIGQKVMTALSRLPRLRELFIEATPVAAAGMAELGNSRSPLRRLKAQGVKLEGFDLRALYPHLDTLESLALDLNGARGVDEFMQELGSKKRVTRLRLEGPAITDSNVPALQKLSKSLVNLSLLNTSITDSSIPTFKRLARLQGLSIDDSMVSDQFVRQVLPALQELTGISVDGTQVTEVGLTTLCMHEGMEVIHLNRTQVKQLPPDFGTFIGALPHLHLQGIEFNDADLAVLRTLSHPGLRFDDPLNPVEHAQGDPESRNTSMILSEISRICDEPGILPDLTSTDSSSSPTAPQPTGPIRQASTTTVLSTTETIRYQAEATSLLHADRTRAIQAQFDLIYESEECRLHFTHLKRSFITSFRKAEVARSGVEPYELSFSNPSALSTVTDVVQTVAGPVPGLGVAVGVAQSVQGAVHTRKVNKWNEGVSALFDPAAGDHSIIADSLARAMALYHREDIVDPAWVKERQDTPRKDKLMDKVEGRGNQESKLESRIRRLAVRQAAYLVEQMVDKQSDLSEAIERSVEQALSDGHRKWQTDPFKIEPILRAHAAKYPHGPDSGDAIVELFVWGDLNMALTHSEVHDKVQRMRKRDETRARPLELELQQELKRNDAQYAALKAQNEELQASVRQLQQQMAQLLLQRQGAEGST